jgi:hypothetical protein
MDFLPESPLKPKPAANPLNYVTKYEGSGAYLDSLPTMMPGQNIVVGLYKGLDSIQKWQEW